MYRLGKAMLANMGEQEIQNYLEPSGTGSITENSITNKEQLYQDLVRTDKEDMQLMIWNMNSGIKCIAMPVFSRNGSLYAAISISGLATHFTEKNISEWAIILKKYVRKIESRL